MSRVALYAGLVLLGLSLTHRCVATTDPRYAPITRVELTHLIATTPISSPAHDMFLWRAKTHGLIPEAVKAYTAVLQKNPNDAHANLMCGIANEDYFEWIQSAAAGEARQPLRSALQYDESAKKCLAKAKELAPNDARVCLANGWFVRYFHGSPDDIDRETARLVKRFPKSADAHMLRGESLISAPKQTGRAVGIQELQTAIRLDPTWAAPHWPLATIFLVLGRLDEAQHEVDQFKSLVPPRFRNTPVVVRMEGWIKERRVAARRGTP